MKGLKARTHKRNALTNQEPSKVLREDNDKRDIYMYVLGLVQFLTAAESVHSQEQHRKRADQLEERIYGLKGTLLNQDKQQ